MISWRWAKIDLPLVVHHVVELQQLLADVEVAPLDLGLRAFERLVHPGVDDRLAFLHAQRAEHLVEPSDPKMRIRSSSRLRKKEDRPGRPGGPDRPRSWLSMRRLSWRSVART
jgi:hypothetical protein